MNTPGTPPILANDFRAQWADVGSRAEAAFRRVGESGWFVLGREVAAFESALAAEWGLPHAIGCANGLDAIELSLRSLGLKPGEKVLTTPLSAFATTLAILRAGGVPCFVDTDESGLIDLDLAERAFEAHADLRWFVPVHLYGHALDLERLAALQRRFDLKLVEDCAQAIGASSRGRVVGTVGQFTATSFYPTKNLGCFGDGGALLTRSEPLAARARTLRDYGQTAKYEHAELGLNSRLDEVQAAILRDALLPSLQRFTARRREIARQYVAGLEGSAVRIAEAPAGSESSWHLFPVRVENAERFIAHLKAHGIAGPRHYPKLIPDQPALAQMSPAQLLSPLDRSRRFAAEEVSLPIHPYLSASEVERVIAACNAYAR